LRDWPTDRGGFVLEAEPVELQNAALPRDDAYLFLRESGRPTGGDLGGRLQLGTLLNDLLDRLGEALLEKPCSLPERPLRRR